MVSTTTPIPGFAKEGHVSRNEVSFVLFLSKEKSRVCWVKIAMPLMPHLPGTRRGLDVNGCGEGYGVI